MDLFKFWNLLQLSLFKQLDKKSQLTFLQQIVALLFLQVQYITCNLKEIIVHAVKAAIIVISEHFNLSTLLVVSHVLSTKVSPEWRKDLGFKKCPSPLNRGVSSTELTDKKIMWIFAWGQISRPLNGSHSLLNRLRCFNEEVLLYNILFMSPVKNLAILIKQAPVPEKPINLSSE